jgi:tetratricopeptide (TPR) repeat protein
LEQFRFGEAAEEFEAAVALEPNSVPGLVNLGIAYFNQRDFDRAREIFEKAKSIDPDDPHVHYNLGLIFKLIGETEEAVLAFEEVAAHDPEDAMTLYYLGTLYASLGRLEEAEATLRQAIRLQPNNESAHFSLGNVLIRQGRSEEGQKELTVFRSLKESFPVETASAGLQYTELGKYAEAIEPPSLPLQQLPPEPSVESAVRWIDVSEELGLTLPPLPPPPTWPPTVPVSEYGRSFVERRLLPHWGSGLALRDLDNDGDPDLVYVRGGGTVVFVNEGGRFRAATTGLPEPAEDGKYVSLTVGDVDNDGDPDVYLVGSGPNALFLNDGNGRFSPAGPEAGVAGNDISIAATLADVDHDGDLDIYVSNYVDPEAPHDEAVLRVPYDLRGAPNRLYRNNGDRTFTEIGEESRTAGASRSLGAVFSDLDDDRDIDFVVVNDGEPLEVYSNDRVGTFTESALDWGLEAAGRFRGIDAADFDRDGNLDLFLTAEGATLNVLLRGPVQTGLRPDVVSPGLLAAGVPGARFGASFLDADNDTDLDALLVVNEPGALAAYYASSAQGFRRAGGLSASGDDVGEGRALAIGDIDGDGDLDAVVGTDRGRLLAFRNEGGNALGSIDVQARGVRSNREGLGTKVEVKAGDARLRREVRAGSGYLSQNDLPLHFGLGTQESADYIRFLWPGGVKQIEMDVEAGRVSFEELDRKGTSCPILYTWDGKEIRFVTDFLGGSAIGYLHEPGSYSHPDTDEYVKLESFAPVPRNGAYDVRWVNQLEEVLMFDKASLVAVDHPAEVEVFPNERLMAGPRYPEPRLYAVRDLRPPVGAVDHLGRDVTPLIARQDRQYPSEFGLLPFKGYAELHSLTLDLGDLEANRHYVLLLYGWIDYSDSSSNLAAGQAGVTLTTPYLEVEDEDGGFRMAIADMGFPAGLPKTMLVDLQGIMDANHRRVRITTSQRIYWDQIQVATVVPDVDPRVTELSPDRAELGFRGYPASVSPDGEPPYLYDYSRISPTEVWDQHEGFYTRYGDVRELVESVDDRYVITKNGDELALSFAADRLPDLPAGWKRTFLVFADGFGKDMDLNSAYADTVEPLPFHAMKAYPYASGETFPETEIHRRDRELYHTRRVERQRRVAATIP